jgi:hypothetical protein
VDARADPGVPVTSAFERAVRGLSEDDVLAMQWLVDELHPRFRVQVEFPFVRQAILDLLRSEQIPLQARALVRNVIASGRLTWLVEIVFQGLAARLG